MDNTAQTNGPENMTINDFEIRFLAHNAFCTEVETGCGGVLPAGTEVRYAGLVDGNEYFYTRNSQGWGLEYASKGTEFMRRR